MGAIATAAGYHHIVNHTTQDIAARVRELTDGRGADVVFDSVGGPRFARSFEMLVNEGTVVLCGRSAGEPDLRAVAPTFVDARRNLGLREFYLHTHLNDRYDEIPERVHELLTYQHDDVITVPTTCYPLEDAPVAHRALAAGVTVGKLVLRPQ